MNPGRSKKSEIFADLQTSRTSYGMNCYFCKENSLKVKRDKLRFGIKRNVLECKNCGLIFQEPKNGVASFYRKEYRQKHGPILGKVLSSRELFEYNLPLQEPRIKELKSILKPNFRVLDIGSSAGHFLYAVKNKVKECVGIELNVENAEFTRNELGIKVFNEPIEEAPLTPDYFDLITIYHTFEHIEDPLRFLKFVYKYLKPKGYLFIEVPNTLDALMSVYGLGSFADFWYIEPHLFFYTPKTLKAMLRKAGFSGTIKTTQSFSFMNHLNWLLTGQPQADWKAGTAVPILVNYQNASIPIAAKLNTWFRTVDQEYRKILNKHQVGGNIVFLGKKAKSKKLIQT